MTRPADIVEDTRTWKVIALMQAAFSYATLSNLLRLLGAGVLVASVSIFLLRGWGSGNDIERYFMLLGHTVLLGVTGLLTGSWVKESKGARLFLALALVSAVVNFTVLGGLVYSQLQWDHGVALYPAFARWQAGSATAALTTAAASLLLLAPVAWISFMTLARRSAARLTVLFMASTATLLIPLREAGWIAPIVLALTVGLLWQVVEARRTDPSVATGEGRFARFILFIPVLVMVGRGLLLYSADVVMLTVVSAVAFVALRQYAADPGVAAKWRSLLNRVSVAPALAVAAGVTGILDDASWLVPPLYLPVFAAVAAALLVEISLRPAAGGAGYRRLAGLIVAVSMLINLEVFPGLPTAAACLVSGLAILLYGYSVQQRIVFATGLLTLLAGVVYQCRAAFFWFDWSNWTMLAVIGFTAIVAGSLLERYGVIVRARLVNWGQSFRQWSN